MRVVGICHEGKRSAARAEPPFTNRRGSLDGSHLRGRSDAGEGGVLPWGKK